MDEKVPANKSDRSNDGPRLRVLLGQSIAIGPGKADLLAAIDREGSITRAAKVMGMSYRRAWLLVETMNACFKAPLVEASRGGSGGGGSGLTDTGRDVLDRYRALEEKAAAAIAEDLEAFTPLLVETARTRHSGTER
ncbi:winged helix-turn-helix domain-containing protein [Algihabitans albus]|uniref:winged helix-turn-helix domain-containing protein n=1 Tax=Algihabitans albus TaxID=2164067 RepID=UPI000E5D98B6|nr:LysR family transcriptional regulator [Algihabitans albus]